MELTDNMVKLTAISYLYFSPRWLHGSAASDNMVKLTAISYLYFSPRWLHGSAASEYHITTTTRIVSDPRLGSHSGKIYKFPQKGLEVTLAEL